MKRPIFSLLYLTAALVLSCSREAPELQRNDPPAQSCVQPDFLQPGDKVALLSPSYYTPMENVTGAAEILRAWGFEPVIGPNVGKEYLGKYAGTPVERLADLQWALDDPSIKAILCNRGGYGTIRLVDLLPREELAAHPKWLVGFSDITTLHGMETRAGVMSIHGTMGALMVSEEGRGLSSTLVRDILTGHVPEYRIPPHPSDRFGTGTGILVGGNLCTFTPLLGTSADATAGDGIILFIEEVEEDMSHIDRLMNMLILNGVLDRCKGIILGEFTDCGANLDYGSVEEMLCSYLTDYDIPVCCGFPAGHDALNLPLIMGAPVTLDVSSEGARLTFGVRGDPVTVRVADALESERLRSVAQREEKQLKLVRAVNFLRYYNGATLKPRSQR